MRNNEKEVDLSEKIKLKSLDLVPDIFGSTHHLIIWQELSTRFKVNDIYLLFPPYPIIDSAKIQFALDNLIVCVKVSLTEITPNVKAISHEKIKTVLNFLSSLEVFPEFQFVPPDSLSLSKAVKLQKKVINLPGISLNAETVDTDFAISKEKAKELIKVATILLDSLGIPWLEAWFNKPDGLWFVTKIVTEKSEYFLEIGVVPWKY